MKETMIVLNSFCKKFLILLFLLSIGFIHNSTLYANQKAIATLENKLHKVNGVDRIETLNILVSEYSQTNSNKSFSYFIESFRLAEKLKLPIKVADAFEHLVNPLKCDRAISHLNFGLRYFQKINSQTGVGFAYSYIGRQHLLKNNFEAAERYQKLALETFTKIDYPYGISLTNERLGFLFMIKNEFLKALGYFYQALRINQKEGFRKEEAISLYHIGLTELDLGNYREAVDNILKTLKYWEEVNNVSNIWNCNELLGNIYIKLNLFEKALYYHRIALKIRNDNILKDVASGQEVAPDLYLGIAYSWNNIAEAYLDMGKYDSAYFYAIKSLKIKEAKNSVATSDDVANSWLNMGNIYRKLGKYDSAFFMINKAAETFHTIQNGSSYAEALYGLGNLYFDRKDYSKAKEEYETGLKKSIEVADKSNIKTGYKLLYDLYKQKNDYKNALVYYNSYTGMKDSIFNKERSNAIEELQIRYEVDKKQHKIESQELIIKQKKRQITYALIGGSLILLLAVIVILLIIKYKRQKEALLINEAESLRKDIELKNRELVCNVSNIYTKNMVINKVAKTLSKSISTSQQTNVELINEIIGELRRNMDETSWKEFEVRFSKVHESFYETLDKKYPELTHAERKICAMLKLDMSSKEIAAITMTHSESIDTTRSRIRKKLGLEKDENLSEFLNKL
jgi:tetratricopeptide (TPR) repeat protein/DNA-binding CsgD family transcriptional regulator